MPEGRVFHTISRLQTFTSVLYNSISALNFLLQSYKNLRKDVYASDQPLSYKLLAITHARASKRQMSALIVIFFSLRHDFLDATQRLMILWPNQSEINELSICLQSQGESSPASSPGANKNISCESLQPCLHYEPKPDLGLASDQIFVV